MLWVALWTNRQGNVHSYQQQIGLHQKLIDISSKFIAGPKEGVDYQALAAKMPEIRAELDEAGKAVFDAAALVFMSLIDMKPDSQGHVSHLLITKAEKASLQDQLEIMLKDIPEKGDHDYYISAAMILQTSAGGRYDSLGGEQCEQRIFECSQLNSVMCTNEYPADAKNVTTTGQIPCPGQIPANQARSKTPSRSVHWLPPRTWIACC